jgi:hypothetical protein
MGEIRQMRSEKQIQASRTNGARSRGPVTAQGKRNSSRNNLRHGFSARDSSLEHNLPPAFAALEAEYRAEFQPGTAYEIQLVHTLAVARWRTFLVPDAEKRAVGNAIARQKAKSGGPFRPDLLAVPDLLAIEDDPEYRPLLRYQVAFHLQFKRALARLMALNRSKSRSPIEENALVVRTQEGLETKRIASEAILSAWVLSTHNPGSSRVLRTAHAGREFDREGVRSCSTPIWIPDRESQDFFRLNLSI